MDEGVDTGDAGIEVCGSDRSDCEQGSLVFSDELRNLFINTFRYNSIKEKIGLYQECVNDSTIQLAVDPDEHYPLGRCEGGKFIHFCDI